MLYGTAQKATDSSEVYDTYYKVAQIGLQKEAAVQKRAEFEQQKVALDEAKISKIFDYVGQANKFKNVGAQNNYLKMGLKYRDSLGMTDRIPDEAITSLNNPEMLGKMATIQRRLFNPDGKPKHPGAYKEMEAWFNDPKLQRDTPITPAEFINTDADFQKSLETKMQMDNARDIATTNKASGQAAINERFDQVQRNKAATVLKASRIPDLDVAF